MSKTATKQIRTCDGISLVGSSTSPAGCVIDVAVILKNEMAQPHTVYTRASLLSCSPCILREYVADLKLEPVRIE